MGRKTAALCLAVLALGVGSGGCSFPEEDPGSGAQGSGSSEDPDRVAGGGDTDGDGSGGSLENPFGGDDPEDRLMPDLVCMDLQSAQDEIQDHGVFFSGSTDATGQGRSQVIDSNWIVVDQFPEPGVPIGEFDAELYVVKFGEETQALLLHPC